MSIKRIAAILFILLCTSIGWGILGSSLLVRTGAAGGRAGSSLSDGWGPPLWQSHPQAWVQSPGTRDGQSIIQPHASKVEVDLRYDPKRRGLLWYRTYEVRFKGVYEIRNPAPIAQTVYCNFQLPSEKAIYRDFTMKLDGKPASHGARGDEGITAAAQLEPGAATTLEVGYVTRGTDGWRYLFGDGSQIRNFDLSMGTDFSAIDFPAGTESPTERRAEGGGFRLRWSYPDVIGARGIGMEMPKVLNPGPVASRITFFAPVSLLFFFAVLFILSAVRRVDLHPMNYFFFAAGCFAFQLLFAYLVDRLPLGWSFAVSAAVSQLLVSGYIRLVAGRVFARFAAAAQFAYMVLFSWSFFFDGFTGLTITIGAIVTLAILMVTTAQVDWGNRFAPGRAPRIPAPEVP
jgi:hypothetical protein